MNDVRLAGFPLLILVRFRRHPIGFFNDGKVVGGMVFLYFPHQILKQGIRRHVIRRLRDPDLGIQRFLHDRIIVLIFSHTAPPFFPRMNN